MSHKTELCDSYIFHELKLQVQMCITQLQLFITDTYNTCKCEIFTILIVIFKYEQGNKKKTDSIVSRGSQLHIVTPSHKENQTELGMIPIY